MAMIKRRKFRPSDEMSPAKKRAMIGPKLSFAAAEAYKVLRTNLMFSMPDENKCRIVGVTSALRGEGKSMTSINLAYSIAQTGKRTLLLEADMRLGRTAESLGLSTSPGLSNLLAGLCSSKDVLQNSGLLENLMVIAAGDVPPNPAELLGSEQMKKLLEALSGIFDFIVVDLPPVVAVSDAAIVSNLVHGMIVVVRQDYCDRESLNETMRQLEFLDTKILGFVMTNSPVQQSKYGKYGRYGRYGRYGKYSRYYSRYGKYEGYGYAAED